jgi:4-diphosphocytidyl-2-C-methyl-D-erythritol kinase
VPAALIEKAPAKINLTLRVLGRRADGYHELESLVAFADLADTLNLQPGRETILEIDGPFAAACGPPADNLVLKAFAALRERVGELKGGRFTLEKKIPVAAGLGGGSADAAAALRLLVRANNLSAGEARMVVAAALAIGADVPVCLASRARIMGGIGDQLLPPLDLPVLPALLVNPGAPLATRDVFAAFAGQHGGIPSHADMPPERGALIEWLGGQGNDLTSSAVACLPVIADVLAALQALPGVRFARMSGSGPTCFAAFASPEEAAAAWQKLKVERKDWWVYPAVIK